GWASRIWLMTCLPVFGPIIAENLKTARIMNGELAAAIAGYPDRFRGAVMLPARSPPGGRRGHGASTGIWRRVGNHGADRQAAWSLCVEILVEALVELHVMPGCILRRPRPRLSTSGMISHHERYCRSAGWLF